MSRAETSDMWNITSFLQWDSVTKVLAITALENSTFPFKEKSSNVYKGDQEQGENQNVVKCSD